MMATMVQKTVDLWNENNVDDDEQSIVEESSYILDRFTQPQERHEKDDQVVELIQKILGNPTLETNRDTFKMLEQIKDKLLSITMYRRMNGLILHNACTINPISDFHNFLKGIDKQEVLKQAAKVILQENVEHPLPLLMTSEYLNDKLTVYGSGPFVLHNCCNHSCEPNCTSISDMADHHVRLVATQPIAKDDPVTISYIENEQTLSLMERRRLLMEKYSFECMCNKCIREEKEMTKN
jgi:hypothetical protein